MGGRFEVLESLRKEKGEKFYAWGIIGLFVVFLFMVGLQSLSIHEPEVALICFVGMVIEMDLGIVQIHIRKVV